MKLYFAGAHQLTELLDKYGVERRLLAFSYLPDDVRRGRVNIHEFIGRERELFLDSGAFSAFTLGREIELKDYIRFIKDHNVRLYANLDDINSWKQTSENQKIMEAAGLTPLPVYHVYEPLSVLKYYCQDYDYVCLGFGPSKSTNEKGRVALSAIDNFPDTKFHLFALTQPELLYQLNLYSADSTTWLNGQKYGTLLTPWGWISFGDVKTGRHYDKLKTRTKFQLQVLAELMGFNIAELKEEYRRRTSWNIKYFLLYEQAVNQFPKPSQKTKMMDSFFSIQRARRVIQRLKRKLWT